MAAISPGKMEIAPRRFDHEISYSVNSDKGSSLIHRSNAEEGLDPDTVRQYLTIYGHQNEGGKHKDIHASGDGIKFVNKKHDSMLNMGFPLRAFHYFDTYQNQNNPASDLYPAKQPIIRSFDLPRAIHEQITSSAISETQRGVLGDNHPYNVDKKVPNQFGLNPAARDLVEQHGRNMISYVNAKDVEELSADKTGRHGIVRNVDDLRRQLGMPVAGQDFMMGLRNAHSFPTEFEKEYGQKLSGLYDRLHEIIKMPSEKRRRSLASLLKDNENSLEPRVRDALGKRNIASMTRRELDGLKNEIGKAATFSVVPQMIKEEYLQANTKAHGQKIDKYELPWAAAQNYDLVVRNEARTVPRAARESDEEQQSRQKITVSKKEELRRAITKAVEEMEPDEENGIFGFIGD